MTQYFIDAENGHRLQVGKWYLCSDSGYLHTEQAFDSTGDAIVWWLNGGGSKAGWPDEPVYIPTYLGPTDYWDNTEGSGEAVMCLRAEDLLDFWRAEGYTDQELQLSDTP